MARKQIQTKWSMILRNSWQREMVTRYSIKERILVGWLGKIQYVIPRMTTLACEYERISVCSRPWFDEYMLAILVLASSTGHGSNTAGFCRHLGITTLCFGNSSLLLGTKHTGVSS